MWLVVHIGTPEDDLFQCLIMCIRSLLVLDLHTFQLPAKIWKYLFSRLNHTYEPYSMNISTTYVSRQRFRTNSTWLDIYSFVPLTLEEGRTSYDYSTNQDGDVCFTFKTCTYVVRILDVFRCVFSCSFNKYDHVLCHFVNHRWWLTYEGAASCSG